MQEIEFDKILKALSDQTRYKIVQLLMERHHCSRSLSLSLGISESAVSQHMAVLKECELVVGCRHRHHIHYQLNPPVLEAMQAELGLWLEKSKGVMDCHGGNPCRYKSVTGVCK